MKRCKECGVPLRIGKGHNWNPDGTITQGRDPDHRMVFLDSDGLNSLFLNIERLIGTSIEKIIIESKARATMSYVSQLLRGPKGPLARVVGLERVIRRVVEQGKVMGYGDIKITDFNWKENYMYCDVGNPYSLPLFCGDLRGANEAIRRVTGTVSYEEIGPDHYLVKNYQAPHVPGIEERLIPHPKPRKPGDIEYNRCRRCGAPLEISRYRWDLEKGTITNGKTGVRMALFGPTGVQVIFDELESELGESIPETIVEAQRMHAESQMIPNWRKAVQEDIRNWLAIQGLGNLVSIETVEEGFTVRIENPALPLIIVGTELALYDFTDETRGAASWSIEEDGDLVLTLSRKKT